MRVAPVPSEALRARPRCKAAGWVGPARLLPRMGAVHGEDEPRVPCPSGVGTTSPSRAGGGVPMEPEPKPRPAPEELAGPIRGQQHDQESAPHRLPRGEPPADGAEHKPIASPDCLCSCCSSCHSGCCTHCCHCGCRSSRHCGCCRCCQERRSHNSCGCGSHRHRGCYCTRCNRRCTLYCQDRRQGCSGR